MIGKSVENASEQAEKLGQQLKTAAAGKSPNADDCLNTLRFLLDTMSTAFGDRVEIVLHDFRQPERSIIAIAGGVTGRKAGGSVTQIGLSIIRAGEDAKDQYSYVTRAPNGRVLKSVTVPLRDEHRHVFGAICVNVDITEMWMMGQSIQNLIGTDEQVEPRPVTFVDDIDGVISDVLKEETRMLGRPLDELSREERLRLLKALDFRGVFSLQRSIPQVADHLGLSRATLYNDLKRMRRAESPGVDAYDERARSVRTPHPTSTLDTETTHDEF